MRNSKPMRLLVDLAWLVVGALVAYEIILSLLSR